MALKIDIEKVGKGVILRIEGRLDAPSTPSLEKEIQKLLQEDETHLLLDFTQVDYLSSAGMRLLLALTKKLKAKHGVVCLYSLSDEVREIIKLAGFEKILHLSETEKEALKFLQ